MYALLLAQVQFPPGVVDLLMFVLILLLWDTAKEPSFQRWKSVEDLIF